MRVGRDFEKSLLNQLKRFWNASYVDDKNLKKKPHELKPSFVYVFRSSLQRSSFGNTATDRCIEMKSYTLTGTYTGFSDHSKQQRFNNSPLCNITGGSLTSSLTTSSGIRGLTSFNLPFTTIRFIEKCPQIR